jgi:hypothetical protein
MNTTNINMNKSKSLITFKEFKNRMEDVHNFGNEWGLFIDIENHTHSFVKAKAEEETKEAKEAKAKAKERKEKERKEKEAKDNLQKKNIQKYIDEYKHIFEQKNKNKNKNKDEKDEKDEQDEQDEQDEDEENYKNLDPNNNNFFNYTFRILIFINLTYAILYLT